MGRARPRPPRSEYGSVGRTLLSDLLMTLNEAVGCCLRPSPEGAGMRKPGTAVPGRCEERKESRRDDTEFDMKRPSMQIGLGFALGAGIGIAVAIGSGGAWLAVGIAIGVAIGAAMSRRKGSSRLERV